VAARLLRGGASLAQVDAAFLRQVGDDGVAVGQRAAVFQQQIRHLARFRLRRLRHDQRAVGNAGDAQPGFQFQAEGARAGQAPGGAHADDADGRT
jgi:hypothetical protein